MQSEFLISTEGVFILTSAIGLAQHYSHQEFDYDYPEGLMDVINKGVTAALTTENGDDLRVIITDESLDAYEGFDVIGSYPFQILPNDTVYLLSHAEFTQICDQYKGTIDAYDFYDAPDQVEGLVPGWYQVDFYGKELDLDEGDYDEEDIYELELIAHFQPLPEAPHPTVQDVLRF